MDVAEGAGLETIWMIDFIDVGNPVEPVLRDRRSLGVFLG